MGQLVNPKPFKRRVLVAITFLTLILTPTFLFSQTNLRIAPGLGLQTLQSYVKESINADRRFRAYNLYATPSFNLNLQVDIRGDWMIFGGWSTYRSVISYKYGDSGPNREWSLTFTSNSFPLGVQKKIGVHRWFKVNGKNTLLYRVLRIASTYNNNKYLLLFKSRIISGVSYDLVKNSPGNLATKNPTNVSAFLGLGLQFFSYNKDRLQLNIFYSQGLKEIADGQVNYFFEGKDYAGVLGSRGSFFTIQVAYPIQLTKL